MIKLLNILIFAFLLYLVCTIPVLTITASGFIIGYLIIRLISGIITNIIGRIKGILK